MNQAREKPKTLLLRKRQKEGALETDSVSWARLGKALKTFTEFEELEFGPNENIHLNDYFESYDHLFLDTEIIAWSALESLPPSKVTLVCQASFAWNEMDTREKTLKSLVRHPCLVLEGMNAADLVRMLHLYLMPKRLAGVAPMMEKGSLIVGEKVMDSLNIGSLLDRLSAHFDLLDGLELKSRIPDLRQVLSGLIFEGLRAAAGAQVSYPFVDFQASAAKQKLGVNMRFPKGKLSFERLVEQTLSGANLFWHQVWQCSDVTILQYHKQQEEIEVTLVLCLPERGNHARFKTLLHKTSVRSARRDNLLEAPDSFVFKLLSDIQPLSSDKVLISGDTGEDLNEIDFGALPENVIKKISSLNEQSLELNEQVQKKDKIMQDLTHKLQQANRELGTKRAELMRSVKSNQVQSEAAEKRIQELEARAEHARKESHEHSVSKGASSPLAMQDALVKLEAMLRAAENEKSQLRETIAHEQKRVSIFEQKHSALYKELSLKDREVNELKTTFARIRKDQAIKQSTQAASQETGDKIIEKKESDDRESGLKQEVRKLTFKLDSQEKNIKAIQNEAAEKVKMLDQKLKAAKVKEIELLKKIEDLMTSLKKAVKAA